MTPNRARPTVPTESGTVIGQWDEDIAVFRGIPYAAPPVEELRFAAPKPHPGWVGSRDCTGVPAAAPQTASRFEFVMGRVDFTQSEDCLTLNVWTPSLDGERLPVLIWIHGGGYLSGSGGWPWYSGDQLSRTGRMVVVSINYRLGALGFLFVPELAGVDRGAANRGLLDWMAALKWVRNNISQFGGDPDKITVAGQSGGGAAVACMMVIPEAKVQFARGIMQSPALLPPFPAPEAERIGVSYRGILGVTTLSELRTLPVERLLQAQVQLGLQEQRLADPMPPLQLTLDGDLLSEPFVDQLMAGRGAGTDVIIGFNNGEMRLRPPTFRQMPSLIRLAIRNRVKLRRPPRHMFNWGDLTRDRVVERFRPVVGNLADSLVAEYEALDEAAPLQQILRSMLNDEYEYRAFRLALDQNRFGSSAWVYSFDWAPPNSPFGSVHTIELPFVFNNPERWPRSMMLGTASVAEIKSKGRPMHHAWAAFAATGNPNLSDEPAWSDYKASEPCVMHFGRDRPLAAQQPLTPGMRIWERTLDSRRASAGNPD